MSGNDLPKIGPSHVQHEESVHALEALLHLPDFILHPEEGVKDYGVDFGIELGRDSKATNARFQLQLRSVATGTFVENDKYITLRLETSQLNYLSKATGQSSLALYEKSSKRIFHIWVHEAIRALEAEGVDWRTTESVTIRIPTTSVLTAESAKKLNAEVALFCNATCARQRTLFLHGQTDPGALSLLKGAGGDPAQLFAVLVTNGLGLSAEGYHAEVLKTFEVIPSSFWTAKSKAFLILAYANDAMGESLRALHFAELAEKAQDRASLDPGEGAVLEYLLLSNRLLLGKATVEEYFVGVRQLAGTTPASVITLQASLECHLQDVRLVGLSGTGLRKATTKIVAEARAAAEALKVAAQGVADLELKAERMLGAIEFEAGGKLGVDTILQVKISEMMKLPLPMPIRQARVAEFIALRKQATDRLGRVMESAKRQQRLDIYALTFLELTEAALGAQFLLSMLDSTIADHLQKPEGLAIMRGLLKTLDEPEGIFRRLQNRKMIVRVLRLKASVMGMLGDDAGRTAIRGFLAREGLEQGIDADAFEPFPSMDPEEMRRELSSPEGLSKFVAEQTDEQVRGLALDLVTTAGLGKAALPHVETYLKAGRLMAAERRTWCKHLNFLENLDTKDGRATHCAGPVARVCDCVKFKIRGKVETTDAAASIAAFKSANCATCKGRET